MKGDKKSQSHFVPKGRLLRRTFFAPFVIILFVLLANSLYLSGVLKNNPVYFQSGLAVQHAKLIGGNYTIDPNDGITTQALGHAAAESLLHFHLPWWNYNEQVGAPLAGDMQPAALFPLTPILALADGVLYFHIILEVIAGLGTYYLLKKLKCGEVAAIVGGMLFAVNGTYAWLGNAVVNPIAFLPLLLLGVEIAYDKALSHKKRGWLVITLAFALSLYAGFPEVMYLDTLLVACWVVVRSIQLAKAKEDWKVFIGKVILGGALGVLLAAPILIAFLDYYRNAFVGIHAGAVGNVALPLASLPALFFPYLFGPIFAATDPVLVGWWGNVGGYLTASLALFAIIGLAAKGNRLIKIFLAAWIVVMVARVYGFPELYRVLDVLPGMSSAAIYRYIQPSFELATVLLASFGLDYLLQNKKLSSRQIIGVSTTLGVICAAVTVLAIKSVHLNVALRHRELFMLCSIGWSLGVLFLIVFAVFSKMRIKKGIYVSLLLIDALLMFTIPNLSAYRSAALNTQPVAYLQQHLGESRFYSLGPIQPNYGTYYGIASIDTNNLPLPQKWVDYVSHDLNPNAYPVIFTGTTQIDANGLTNQDALFKYLPAYRYVGVKYVVAPVGTISAIAAQTNGLAPVFQNQNAVIYQVANSAPYYQILSGDCRIMTSTPASVQVNCKQSGILLRRELYMPGWLATGGSVRLAVKQSGPLFQSVQLPKGIYTVYFDFLPPYMKEAGIALLIGWIVIVSMYFNEIRRVVARLLQK